jgi:nucleotide-binding universal stress UspA family protein
MVDQIIIESGRPVLVVPYAGHYDDVGQRPLFAWNDSRSAARALNDALPLLAKPCDATVVTFEQPNASSGETMAAILKHLSSHGVTGKEDRLIVQDVGIMDMLLNRAAEHGSDLLVAGAFGGYGFPVLSRVWPPLDGPAQPSAWVFCGDALTGEPAEVALDPIGALGTFSRWGRASCVKFGGASLDEGFVVPPSWIVCDGAPCALEPGGIEVAPTLARTPATCDAGEVAFGDGCAAVEENDAARTQRECDPVFTCI